MLNIDLLKIQISNINCFPIINIPKKIYEEVDPTAYNRMVDFKQLYNWYDGKGYNF